MRTTNYTGMDRKAAAATTEFFGVSSEIVSTIVNKYVRKAVKEQNEIGCPKIVETFSATGAWGADRYRISICGAYNDLQNGGTKKTDRSFADIMIERMGWNGRYQFFSKIRTDENGISSNKYAENICGAIYEMFYDYLTIAAVDDNMAAEMISALGSDETLGSDDESDAIAEQMSEVVAEYQIKVDEQMMALHAVADSFDKIKYRIDYAKAASVVRRIEKLSWDCLQDCGKISGCEMVPDDGYCPNIDALIKWSDGVLIDDLEETLDYMAVYEDRVAPIATDMVGFLDSEWGYDYVMAPMTEDEAIKWYSLNYEDIKAMADEQKIELYALAF